LTTHGSRAAVLAAVALALAGCRWMNDDKGMFVDRSTDYVKAQPAAPLEVPEGLSASAITPEMSVPELPPDASRQVFVKDVPRPEAIYARDTTDSVRIQKLGERRWLLVPQSPAIVWPKVKQFFADSGVAIAAEDADRGRLETQWLTADPGARDIVRLAVREGRAASGLTGGRDRLKIVVEQGIRERTAEIHVRHENDSVRAPVEGKFPEVSDAVSVESEVIGEIGSYIASNVADQSVSFVARGISTQTKAELVRTDGDVPALRLALDFNRAWALVNQSLGDAGVPVTDVDRSEGVVYAQVNRQILEGEARKKKGVLRRLFSGGDKGYPVEVRLRSRDDLQEVLVVGEGGRPIAAEDAEQLLLLIREFAT
jgi:outer membrane protein assembly factor BamC